MQPIGEPVVCEHPSENLVDNLKSEINVHVDDHIYWFKIENFETGFYLTNSGCHSFVCLNRYGIIVVQKGLIKPIAWEIRDQSLQFDSRYRQLLAFYLLPQKASFQREGNNIKRKSPLNGPNCKIEIKFSGKDYRILINEKKITAEEIAMHSRNAEIREYITITFIAVNIILLVSVVGVLCWYCFCRKEGNNEGKK
ncbi:unnamed protein product [Meloidogyne enterolobii]|uniref:Uncharacterized protein n=1 Tax=Meloidogyne enterolobii TaxID=390850 RepID=A0ACB0ZGH9_MELEN